MRRVLVTGGNRGIGAEIAKGLVAAGLDVVIAPRDLEAGQAVAGSIGCSAVEMDLADRDSLQRGLAAAGQVDVLINNAGVLFDEPLLSEDARFDESLAVMVHAPYLLMQAVVPGMIERGYGRVVNVSSGWGSYAEGLGGPGAYGVAKAALNALTVRAAREAPPLKINAMCPGWVRTRMGGASANLSPEEGADTAIFLATLSDDGPTGRFFRNRREIEW